MCFCIMLLHLLPDLSFNYIIQTDQITDSHTQIKQQQSHILIIKHIGLIFPFGLKCLMLCFKCSLQAIVRIGVNAEDNAAYKRMTDQSVPFFTLFHPTVNTLQSIHLGLIARFFYIERNVLYSCIIHIIYYTMWK